MLVGDDGLVPFFRVPDRTTLAPEASYATAFAGNNELVGALARNYMLTDDPYGASAGIQTNVDELFVPEVGVGRLGETPEAIAAAMNRFVEFDGKLDASTAYSALVTGYEFLGERRPSGREQPRREQRRHQRRHVSDLRDVDRRQPPKRVER